MLDWSGVDTLRSRDETSSLHTQAHHRTAAIDHSNNNGTSKRTFHIERWEYFFRECTQRHWIGPHWLGTKFQMADAMTKVIDATHFLIFRDFVLVVINDEVIAALKRRQD